MKKQVNLDEKEYRALLLVASFAVLLCDQELDGVDDNGSVFVDDEDPNALSEALHDALYSISLHHKDIKGDVLTCLDGILGGPYEPKDGSVLGGGA